MSSCLIGHTGFVGSNLLQQRDFTDLYNSKNIGEISAKSYEELVCCGVPGTKWLANKNPKEDQESINLLLSALKNVRAKRVILISTIDVYQKPDSTYDESHDPVDLPHYPYGVNRRMVERVFKELYQHVYILRLPGLFGKGLKKNPIYDLINSHYLSKMNANSVYQWYYLEHLNSDIEIALKNDLRLVNLFTEPLSNREIIQRFFSDKCQINSNLSVSLKGDVADLAPAEFINYDLRTKHSKYFAAPEGYIRSKTDVLADLEDFLDEF